MHVLESTARLGSTYRTRGGTDKSTLKIPGKSNSTLSDLGLPLLEAVDADPIPGLLDEDIGCRRHPPHGREVEVDVLQIHRLRSIKT